jgi:phage terminase large subunit
VLCGKVRRATQSNVNATTEAFRQWRLHPGKMVRDLFKVVPDAWQDEALRKFPTSPRICMRACTGPGKTCLLAWIAWNFILTRPHSMIGVTSISADNLRANLWTELARWYGKSELLQNIFEMTKTVIYARQHPDTWKIEARTWAKDANPEQLGAALRGLHAPYVMWLLDESGDYPDGVLPVCEAIFSGMPKEAHIVQAGNPIKLGGPLYQATMNTHLWEVINITADPDDPMRTPRVSVEHAREQINTYGRDNPWVRVNIFGLFPQSSLNTLIGPDEIIAATKRSYHPDDVRRSARILGVDVARFGDDMSVIWPRQGLVAFAPMRYRNIDGIQGAGVVSRKWEDWEADACFVDDTGGFGASWIDNLRLLGRAPIPVLFSHEPNDRRYFNKRAEMYFAGAQWIKDGGQLPPMETPGMTELMRAMTRTSYSFKGDRLILEPKDMIKTKIGHSPDDADSFCVGFAQPVALRGSEGRRRSSMQAEYDPFAEFGRVPQRGGMRSEYDPYGGR